MRLWTQESVLVLPSSGASVGMAKVNTQISYSVRVAKPNGELVMKLRILFTRASPSFRPLSSEYVPAGTLCGAVMNASLGRPQPVLSGFE